MIAVFALLLTSLGLVIWYSRIRETPLTLTSQAENQSNSLVETVSPENQVTLAAPGRVESIGETFEIGTAVNGVLSSVPVREGQKVSAGQILAIVSCDELNSEIASARATVESGRQTRARLVRGSREEERQRVEVEITAAQSTLNHAELHYQRMTSLVKDGVIARAEWETAKRDYELAQASVKSAEKRKQLVNAPPLQEELAKADADIQAAAERVKMLNAQLDKCVIKSPISGTVLRVYLRAGESVSPINPRSLMSIADTLQLRVRAEVDERDIGRVVIGQQVKILVDAYPDRQFTGTVGSIGDSMGRKNVQTGEPSEKSDRDVMDVLIDLNKVENRLIVGLRVTVQFIDSRQKVISKTKFR